MGIFSLFSQEVITDTSQSPFVRMFYIAFPIIIAFSIPLIALNVGGQK